MQMRGSGIRMTAEEDFQQTLDDAATNEDLREQLRNASKTIIRLRNKSETLAEAALDGAKAAMQQIGRPKITPYTPREATGKGKPEIALAHLTDWQGAKLTTTYNSDVMRKRVKAYVKNALQVTEIQRADHPVNDLVVMLGGDMIEGLFNFPTQPYEIDMTLFDQFVNVASLLDEILRQFAQAFAHVHVVAEWGNHGRIGSHRDVVPKADNADRMTYQLAMSMGKDVPNLTWSISEEDIQRVEIGKYRALLIHGDEVGRTGFAAPATIVQHANKWRSGAYRVDGEPWEFRDVYMGHYHTHAQWAMANGIGNLYQTGSTESDNRYASVGLASSATPSQRLHFVDPRKGRVTAQYQIWLDE